MDTTTKTVEGRSGSNGSGWNWTVIGILGAVVGVGALIWIYPKIKINIKKKPTAASITNRNTTATNGNSKIDNNNNNNNTTRNKEYDDKLWQEGLSSTLVSLIKEYRADVEEEIALIIQGKIEQPKRDWETPVSLLRYKASKKIQVSSLKILLIWHFILIPI